MLTAELIFAEPGAGAGLSVSHNFRWQYDEWLQDSECCLPAWWEENVVVDVIDPCIRTRFCWKKIFPWTECNSSDELCSLPAKNTVLWGWTASIHMPIQHPRLIINFILRILIDANSSDATVNGCADLRRVGDTRHSSLQQRGYCQDSTSDLLFPLDDQGFWETMHAHDDS